MHEIKKRNNKRRLITSALPYVNNEPHLGNLLQVLSADVFARFSRIKGYETIYICGTDEYGTATEMRALELGTSEYQLCSHYHQIHAYIYDWFGVSFDIFSRTSEAVHTKFTQEIFKRACRNGYISKVKEKQFYCESCGKFLSDRFVEGECSVCGSHTNADQCDNCGTLIENEKLIEPRCKVCGNKPILKDTENLALNLPKLKDELEEFVLAAEREKRWPSNAIGIAKAWLRDGLKEKTITRDIKWGIKVPMKNYENKVFYVWFDACIGYISMTSALTDEWRDWWMSPDKVELYQFIGKDNIPFHTLIFPATQMATKLPFIKVHRLNSSEYLTFEGGKFSKSNNIGVFGTDCVEAGFSPDIWRFYLFYNRPEKSDSDFTFDDFQEKINTQLVGNFSNLINRAFVFLQKEFGSRVPNVTPDMVFYNQLKEKIVKIDSLYEDVQIKDTIHEIFFFSDMLNKYFQENEPWKLVKTNKDKCARVMKTLFLGIKDLCIMFGPFIPYAAITLAEAMSVDFKWSHLGEDFDFSQTIQQIGYLFEKMPDDEISYAKELFNSELAKSANQSKSKALKVNNSDGNQNNNKNNNTNAVGNNTTQKGSNMKDFRLEGESFKEAFRRRVNIKVSKIVGIKKHPEGDKLYILTLDTGEPENRIIVSSIVPFYSEEQLLNHNILLVANLKPANFRGVKSHGMLLAASDKDDDSHSTCEVLFADDAEVGENVYPEGTTSECEYGTYLKAEHFFSIPFSSENGIVKVDGAALITEKTNIVIKSLKYSDANIG